MEQRMSSNPNTNHATSSSYNYSRPGRPASSSSLRHYREQRSKSRRQSMDTTEEGSTSSIAPMTYFPNPSSLMSSPAPQYTHSRPPSILEQGSQAEHHEGGGDGDKTPTMSMATLDSAASSPRTRRNTLGDRRRESAAASASASASGTGLGQRSMTSSGTSDTGYGSTSHTSSLAGLGLGAPERRSTTHGTHGDALSSPRRISTSSHHPSPTLHQSYPHPHAHPRRTQSPGSLVLAMPSNEAYYSQSQVSSASTPRYREREVSTNLGLRLDTSSHGTHVHNPREPRSSSQTPYFRDTLLLSNSTSTSRHQRSASAAYNSPFFGGGGGNGDSGPQSPVGSVFRRLRKTASTMGLSVGKPDHYDADQTTGTLDAEDAGQKANGTRVWYSSYVTIDWIHDAIKESTRVRRLRQHARRSLRGAIANSWDRIQGWIAATLIGIISAIIAFLIIRTEMALFDLKEGFCSTSWGTAKRFCCSPHHRSAEGQEEVCGDWVQWGQLFNPHQRGGARGEWIWGKSEFIAYTCVALALASLASILTVYLSSSLHHTTSKDSALLAPSFTAQVQPPSAKPSTTSEREPLLVQDFLSPIPPSPPSQVAEAGQNRKVMFYAAGSGIPEIKTILSGFVIHGYLGGWTLLTKSVGLALSVASGLSLGKEGPLVHISSCVGNIISRIFTKFECNEAKRREVLSAACAAGVAVAFGAPIGGVLFSLEEVSYYFPPKVMWRSFWCAAVAAITLKSLNPFGNGSLVLFAVTYTKQYHYWEFAVFIVLGLFGGIYGAVFSRLNILWSKHVRQGTWIKRHPIIEVLFVTALTTGLSFLNPYCRMGGTELVASLFEECKPGSSSSLCVDSPREIGRLMSLIGSALLIKGGLTIITFGIKLPAGIFIPSLLVGACFGRIVGLGMEWIEYANPHLAIFDVCRDTDCIVPGLYAMVGAAATLAGVTRTTISLVVIMLELTNTLNYVVPVMLGVLIAKTVADGLEKKGIYDLVIDLNQLPYLDQKHEYLWGSRQVSEIADRDIPHLRADKPHTVRSLTGKLLELARLGLADTGFPILVKEVNLDEGRPSGCLRVVGFLGMNELEHALAVLANDPDANLSLMPEDTISRQRSVMSILSFAESYSDARHSPYDIARYIDRAPLVVQVHSPLELVQQLFVKLGARQLLVTDSRGVFKGMITKKAWLNFLVELEEEGR